MVWQLMLIPAVAATANGKVGKRLALLLGILLIAGGVAYYLTRPSATTLVLTGIVTTNDVAVSPQIQGRIAELSVKEGDTVTRGQLVAEIAPAELRADSAYYAQSAEGYSSQVATSEAALRYQEEQTAHQIQQAEASLAAAIAQQAQANANLENARLNFERTGELVKQGVLPPEQLDQTRTAYDAARANVEALAKQVEAQRAAVALAQSNAEQIAVRKAELAGNRHQEAAAKAQKQAADVRLAYTRIQSPIDGIVDVLAARLGEVVNAGQPVLTLINPDDLWVRADVPETYIDGIHLGDKFTVRLPSGAERQGTVFDRGVDADYATQRDVSRTKRDIKTFEVRLRVDNRDRRLAVGMTVYVMLPIAQQR
jgi:multidrug resistance efflux pump